MPPLPSPAILPISLPHVGGRVLHFPDIGSTNDYLLALSGDPEREGWVVTAGHQTAGRGQRGRAWESRPRSSLLLSALVFPPPMLSRPAILTAWAAVAVGRAVRRLAGTTPAMKWPNDLLLGGRKCCGILTERNVGTVVGLGLNLSQTPAEFVAAGLPHATSLAAFAGRPVAWGDALSAVLAELDGLYGELLGGELAGLEAEWRAMLGLEGERVVVELADGGVIEGKVRSIRFRGVAVQGEHGDADIAPEFIRRILPAGLG